MNILEPVYGPFNLWFVGPCIGVDPLMAFRQCDLDCIYCPFPELGSIRLPNLSYLKEHLQFLTKLFKDPSTQVPNLIIAGPGEPARSPYLLELIREIRSVLSTATPRVQLILATRNPTLLVKRPDFGIIADELDYVMVRLDAFSDKLFRSIYRPKVPLSARTVEMALRLLARRVKLLVEVLLMRGLSSPLNTDPLELRLLLELIIDLSPELVALSTPLWLEASEEARPVDMQYLREVASILADYLGWGRLRVLGLIEEHGTVAARYEDPAKYLYNIVARFPLRIKEAEEFLGSKFRDALNNLVKTNMVKVRGGIICPSGSHGLSKGRDPTI